MNIVFFLKVILGKVKSVRNRINKGFTGTDLKIPKSENRKNLCFWEEKLFFGERRSTMRKKNYKGRCEKVSVSKSEDLCRLYRIDIIEWID